MNKAFKVKIECKNCGYEFRKSYGRNTRVCSENKGVKVIQNIGLGGEKTETERLVCPVCELRNHLDVVKRKPIDV